MVSLINLQPSLNHAIKPVHLVISVEWIGIGEACKYCSSISFAKCLGTPCWLAITSINFHLSRCFLSGACICLWSWVEEKEIQKFQERKKENEEKNFVEQKAPRRPGERHGEFPIVLRSRSFTFECFHFSSIKVLPSPYFFTYLLSRIFLPPILLFLSLTVFSFILVSIYLSTLKNVARSFLLD